MAFVTNGHSRWPHQMVIRFKEIDDIDDIEQVEGNGFLHTGIHVWVDVGDRIGVEFLIDLDIMRDTTDRWIWAPESVCITTHSMPSFYIICTDNQGNFRPLSGADEKVLTYYRKKYALTERTPFVVR